MFKRPATRFCHPLLSNLTHFNFRIKRYFSQIQESSLRSLSLLWTYFTFLFLASRLCDKEDILLVSLKPRAVDKLGCSNALKSLCELLEEYETSVWLDKPEHAARLHPPGSACPNQYQVITSAACKKQTLVLSAHDTRPPHNGL